MAVRAMSEGGDQDIDSQCLSKVHVLKGRRGGCWSPPATMVNDVVDADGATLLLLLMLMMLLPPPRKLLARDEKLFKRLRGEITEEARPRPPLLLLLLLIKAEEPRRRILSTAGEIFMDSG